MDLATLGLVAGTGWASGVNLYLVVLLVGGSGRLGWAEVPAALTRTDVLVLAAVLFALEFVIDKLPYLDTTWDVLHTFIRPLGAAVLGLVVVGEADTPQQALAALASGGLASAAHVAKATTRAAINTSPEPASNLAVSLVQDGLVAGVVWFAVTNPAVALALVAVLVMVGTVLTVTLVRVARRGLRRWRARRRPGGSAGEPDADGWSTR